MSQRRKLVPIFQTREISKSRACELIGISRRRLTYASRKDDAELVARLKTLAQAHPRFGVRSLWRQIRHQGLIVNLKRVRRLCRTNGLLLKQKRRRKRLGIGAGLPCKAEYPNHVWSYDFVEDRTETGRKLRILTIVDEFTRRCIELEVEHRMNAKFVARSLLKQFEVHGTPRFIRSDNGPEFIAKFLMNVLKLHGVEARHIDPGSPWQNGIDERFNGTLRDECLNLETFHGRDHARAVIRLWKRFYNAQRPHSSLGKFVTPQEFYQRWRREREGKKDGCAGDGGTGLTHCAPNVTTGLADVCGKERGLAEACSNQPVRPVIHVGARVAPQQCSILRVDEASVATTELAGTFPSEDTE